MGYYPKMTFLILKVLFRTFTYYPNELVYSIFCC